MDAGRVRGCGSSSGTALSLSHHPHWYVRGWDFPRVLIAVLSLASGVLYRAFFFEERWWEIAWLAALGAVICYQASRDRRLLRPWRGSR